MKNETNLNYWNNLRAAYANDYQEGYDLANAAALEDTEIRSDRYDSLKNLPEESLVNADAAFMWGVTDGWMDA
jgi:hypothetical protein